MLVKLANYIRLSYRKGIKSIIIWEDHIVINVKKEELLGLSKYLQLNSNLKMEQLLDIWGVDYPSKKERFEVNYLFLSVRYNV